MFIVHLLSSSLTGVFVLEILSQFRTSTLLNFWGPNLFIFISFFFLYFFLFSPIVSLSIFSPSLYLFSFFVPPLLRSYEQVVLWIIHLNNKRQRKLKQMQQNKKRMFKCIQRAPSIALIFYRR